MKYAYGKVRGKPQKKGSRATSKKYFFKLEKNSKKNVATKLEEGEGKALGRANLKINFFAASLKTIISNKCAYIKSNFCYLM